MADDDSYRSLSQTVNDTRSQIKSGRDSRAKSAVQSAGRSLQASGQAMMAQSRSEAASRAASPSSYRKGGKVKRAGIARLHSDERVIPANKRKKVERLMKRSGMRLTNRKGSKRR